MKRFHVVSMLHSHQEYAASLRFKGQCLRYAEALMAGVSIIMAAVIFSR